MANEVEKYKLDPVPREVLLSVIVQKLQRNDCESIEWTTLPKATRMKPPPSTTAVVVDITESHGAIHITKENGEYVDMVGTECAGNLVVVPWDSSWCLRGSGLIEVGYVIGKDNE